MDRFDLLERVHNSFIKYITNLEYGKTDDNYTMLYNSLLVLNPEIGNSKFIEFFYNRLNCEIFYKLYE